MQGKRKGMKVLKGIIGILMAVVMVLGFAACADNSPPAPAATPGNQAAAPAATPAAPEAPANTDPIVMVWNPNESGSATAGAREAFSYFIERATGRPVEHMLTTDYVIAIEAISSGAADLAYMGAIGYITASNRNPELGTLVTVSGASGTLDDALYFSWFAVQADNADDHRDADGNLTIDNIPGKRMTFVSLTSTSGFVVPSADLISYFEAYGIDEDSLVEPGFFSEVLFGGSHQGAMFNVLDGRADVGAFADIVMMNYLVLVEGEHNQAGAVYAVREGAEAPFHNSIGEQIILIRSLPVLNPPFVFNPSNLTPEEIEAIRQIFITDEVADNEDIFFPADGDTTGLFRRSANERLVLVEDAWYQPLRDLAG
jgi:phosphonate transport system substrate-binding protein